MSPIQPGAMAAARQAAAEAEAALRDAAAEAGADIPADAPFVTEITYLDPTTKATTRQGFAWLETCEPEQRAELMTWLAPDAVIPEVKLDEVERYLAQASMTKILFDEIVVRRTGRVVDLSASTAKLRALRAARQ